MVEMNLLPPPLSLPRPIPPPPLPPVFSYKKKFADNVADSFGMGVSNVQASANNVTNNNNNNNGNNNNKYDNNYKNENQMDEEGTRTLFGEFWDSEYPRMGEGRKGEVERVVLGVEGGGEGVVEGKREGEGKRKGEGEESGEKTCTDKNRAELCELQSTSTNGFSSWRLEKQPEEGWKVIPKIDRFRSIVLDGREEINRNRIGDPLSVLTDDNDRLLRLYGCEGEGEREGEREGEGGRGGGGGEDEGGDVIRERRNMISSMIEKYEMEDVENEEDGEERKKGEKDGSKEREKGDEMDDDLNERFMSEEISVGDLSASIDSKQMHEERGERESERDKERGEDREGGRETEIKMKEGRERDRKEGKDTDREREGGRERERERERENSDDTEGDEERIPEREREVEKEGEEMSTMVYSRIHGYRINMAPGPDSTSVYKRALGGLSHKQVRIQCGEEKRREEERR